MSNNLFPVVVGQAIIRSADDDGKFFKIECASNVKTIISTSENTVKLSCGKGGSVTFEKPSGTLSLKVIKTKNPTLLGELLDLVVLNSTAGNETITNKKHIFDEDGVIEMLERSNDGNGVTSLIIKSEDGITTYSEGTDYEVKVVQNKTIITVKGNAILPKSVVLISGSLNRNASKELTIERIQRIKKKFTIELFGVDEKTGKVMTITATPVELNSEYLLEMFDVFEDGEPAGAELSFVLCDNGKITYRDEII